MKINNFLKEKARRWLGIGYTFAGIDLNFKDESVCIIVSRLNGGQIRIIDCRFHNMKEFESVVRSIKDTYGLTDKDIIIDLPSEVKNWIPRL